MRQIYFVLAMCLAAPAFAESYVGADGPTFETSKERAPEFVPGVVLPQGWEDQKITPTLKKVRALPAKFSWADKMTPIRNQGSCGSCWAFSAQATLADVMALHGKGSLDLSEQWMVSCDDDSSGCGGGWYHSAFDLVIKDGNVLEKSMPYTASNGRCKSVPHVDKIKSYKTLASGVASTDLIKQAIYQYGPVSVAVVVAGGFQGYKSGIYNEGAGIGSVNHAVNLIGWDDTVKPGHWIMRNSWGASWGEPCFPASQTKGCMRIAYGSRKIGYAASYIDFMGPVPHDGPVPPDPTPGPTPTPTPDPQPCPDCEPCTFWRWILHFFGV